MYKATDPTQVKVLTDQVPFFPDVSSALALYQSYGKKIKFHSEECKLDPSVMVHDLALATSGPMEDEFFSANPKLWRNFRRGNTLIDFYDP